VTGVPALPPADEPAPATDTALEWLLRHARDHGRPLRVLHIGNIANNAYNNAKIQRRHGIDADVICHDYYHVMGTPEWEDADFRGDVGDPFYPDWWKVDLGGFSRPAWFAQGHVRTCQHYLLARRRKQSRREARLWRKLRVEQWLACRSTRAALVATVLLGRPRTDRSSLRRLGRVFATVRLAFAKLFALVRALGAVARGASWREAAVSVFPRRLAWLITDSETARRYGSLPFRPEDRFTELFPNREPLTFADYVTYLDAMRTWRALFEHYDVVQAYSTDPVIPLLAGVKRFAAYEHGTLREIPFHPTSEGRLCALTYRLAPVVFITNLDVVDSARRLGLTDEQTICLPHAVDSDKLLRFAAGRPELQPNDGPPLLFSPTRHDWRDDDPSWAKGNDRFLHALARLRDEGHAFRAVLVAWGRDLEESRRLVGHLGLGAHVSWLGPLRKRDLWAEYLRSHAVIDQFVVGAIGGVAFEAMAFGRRVITALDVPLAERFFGESPPVLAAGDVDEIAAALRTVVADPLDRASRGLAAQRWFTQFHSARRVVELQAAAYRRLVREGDEPIAEVS
jgi:glycosyltransferase involved in cell wall biosynthesis